MRFPILILFLLYHILLPAQRRYDVVIHEVMADPSPQVGLPNVEYVEIKNISDTAFNLTGWSLLIDEQAGRISSDFILLPDSFVILCSSAALRLLSGFGPAVVVNNFPSINNDHALLALEAKNGVNLHAFLYEKSLYETSFKSEGGWSLELVDALTPCTIAGNWKASLSSTGGTPGHKNSVQQLNPDRAPPVLLDVYAPDSSSLLLIFNEPLDSTSAMLPSAFILSSDYGSPAIVELLPPLFDQMLLRYNRRFKENELLQLVIQGMKDCSGNLLKEQSIETGLAGFAEPFDLVINELLFNPRPAGIDYVEMYNRSKKIIDLKNIWLAGRQTNGSISSAIMVTGAHRLLLPGKICLLAEDLSVIRHQYVIKDESALLEVKMLPSLPDDKGNLMLLNAQGSVLDELHYDEGWHFPLLNNKEGVSLERVNKDVPTQNHANWHSAPSSSGFGTPGYTNAQAYEMAELEKSITIDPVKFSPDNNGVDDFANILYRFPSPGYVMSLTIFAISGNPVRYLVRNQLCGITGVFRWDGLDEKKNRLSSGIYVLLIECFNLEGKKIRYKKTITLAGN